MTEQPTILVVDDNRDLLETFTMILKRRGFHVETADNGAIAVDKCRDQCFDVTLMDIVMPEMNGVEALREIKQLHPEATVILMTAYSEDELINMAISEGAHEIVHKPIRIDQLVSLIKEAAAQPILIVDDDADIRQTLSRAFEMEGYQVLAAESGEEAIMIIKEQSCRIAFIDVKLPKIDGLETLLRLKEINPRLRTVMMTGFRNEVKDALDKAQAASAVTCLYKPFHPAEAAELVKNISKKGSESASKHERAGKHTGS